MKYRKKPVVIDAVQWTGTNKREIFDFLTNDNCPEEYMTSDFPIVSDNFYIDKWKVPGGLVIKTLEGEHLANIGDYIIRGVHGEFYPCKPDIFKKTYEKVEAIGHLKSTNWIPVEEKLPDPDKYILVSFFNSSIPMIGRYTVDDNDGGTFRVGDEDDSFGEHGLYVNAWMPLPEPYEEG